MCVGPDTSCCIDAAFHQTNAPLEEASSLGSALFPWYSHAQEAERIAPHIMYDTAGFGLYNYDRQLPCNLPKGPKKPPILTG